MAIQTKYARKVVEEEQAGQGRAAAAEKFKEMFGRDWTEQEKNAITSMASVSNRTFIDAAQPTFDQWKKQEILNESPIAEFTIGPEERLQKKQQNAIDQALASVEEQKKINKEQANIMGVASGLYDPIYDDAGNLTGTKLNQEKLEKARANTARQDELADMQIGLLQDQINFAKDIAPLQAELLKEQVNTQIETAKQAAGISEVTRLQLDRVQKALRGELPVSEATTQQKARDFQLFKEAQARAGNPIEGDSPETASASSTPGIQALENFKKTYALREDEEKRGIINQGVGGVYGLPGSTPNTLAPGYGGSSQSPIFGLTGSAATTFGPGSSTSGYGGISQLSGQALQPYQFNRQLQSSIDAQNAANQAQSRSDLFGLIGTVAGTAGGLLAMSSKTFKHNIEQLNEQEEDSLLNEFSRTPVSRWQYNGDTREHVHIGVVTEEAPQSLVTDDGKHLDVIDYLGVLTVSIKALNRKFDRVLTLLEHKEN